MMVVYLLLGGIALLLLVLLWWAYRTWQRQMHQDDQGEGEEEILQVTFPAESRSGQEALHIHVPEFLWALGIAVFRLVVCRSLGIVSHWQARSMLVALIQHETAGEEEEEEAQVVEQDTPSHSDEKGGPNPFSSPPDRNKEDSIFPLGEGGSKSYDLPGLLGKDPRAYIVALRGFLWQIHYLAQTNGGRITRDGCVGSAKGDPPEVYWGKLTQVEWNSLIGPLEETQSASPGLLRQAQLFVVHKQSGETTWPYAQVEDAWKALEPWLHIYIRANTTVQTKEEERDYYVKHG